MGEYAGMLPRKFFSFHCLENESNELKESNTEETEKFPDLPRRRVSDVVCSDGGESPDKKLADLKVMPVYEIRKESTERVAVANLPNVVESVGDVSHDESQIFLSHLLGECLEVLDDTGLRQLNGNIPEEFGTGLEEERSGATVRGVSVGQITENVTIWTMLWTWRVGIGIRHHQTILFMQVVNVKLKCSRLKRNVCCVRRLFPSKLEMEATTKVWHFDVKLGQ